MKKLLWIVVLGFLIVSFAQANDFYEKGIKKNIEWKCVEFRETFKNSRWIKNNLTVDVKKELVFYEAVTKNHEGRLISISEAFVGLPYNKDYIATLDYKKNINGGKAITKLEIQLDRGIVSRQVELKYNDGIRDYISLVFKCKPR